MPVTKNRSRPVLVTLLLAFALACGALVASARFAPPSVAAATPIRAAFYYPWFAETWHATDKFHPSAGAYDSGNRAVVDKHMSDLAYAGEQAVIASWWGVGTHQEQTRFPMLMSSAAAHGLTVTPYYEKEGSADTPLATIKSDLGHLAAYEKANPSGIPARERQACHLRLQRRIVDLDLRRGLEVEGGHQRLRGLVRQHEGLRRLRVLRRPAVLLAPVRTRAADPVVPALLLQREPGLQPVRRVVAAARPRPAAVPAEPGLPGRLRRPVAADDVVQRVGRGHVRRVGHRVGQRRRSGQLRRRDACRVRRNADLGREAGADPDPRRRTPTPKPTPKPTPPRRRRRRPPHRRPGRPPSLRPRTPTSSRTSPLRTSAPRPASTGTRARSARGTSSSVPARRLRRPRPCR